MKTLIFLCLLVFALSLRKLKHDPHRSSTHSSTHSSKEDLLQKFKDYGMKHMPDDLKQKVGRELAEVEHAFIIVGEVSDCFHTNPSQPGDCHSKGNHGKCCWVQERSTGATFCGSAGPEMLSALSQMGPQDAWDVQC
jgi:hypothetical protein